MESFLRFAVFLISATPVYLFGQNDTTYYFNKRGGFCAADTAASFSKLHLVDTAKNIYEIQGFYMNGAKKELSSCVDRNINWLTGKYAAYNEEGTLLEEGTYVTDKDKKLYGLKIGDWHFYHWNGKRQADFSYILDTAGLSANSRSSEGILSNSWDTSGVLQVVNGTGQYKHAVDSWDSSRIPQIVNGEGPYQHIAELRGEKQPQNSVWCFETYKQGKKQGEAKAIASDGTVIYNETYDNNKLVQGTSYSKGRSYNYNRLEEMPEFAGGEAELIRFLSKNIVYPKYERNNDIQGRVVLRFAVDLDGRVTDIEVLRSVSRGLDKEAMRVTSLLPQFNPGKQRGIPVKVYYTLPIQFKLN